MIVQSVNMCASLLRGCLSFALGLEHLLHLLALLLPSSVSAQLEKGDKDTRTYKPIAC